MSKKFKKDVGAILHTNGVSFRVWAPFASSVAVTGSFNDWGSDPMVNEEDGYWHVHIRGAIAGQEYKYVITNGDKVFKRNDPRALHFTTTSGNSVIVDQHFDWEDDDFQPIPREKQVLYEMHIGTFNRSDPSTTGTFRTAIEKLDFLASLGINMIEVMPINSMVMDRGWGYAIDYIFAIESLYGGRYEFMCFVREAHKRGIGIIVDVVYNHFGPDNNLDLWQFDGWSSDNKGGIYFYNDWRGDTPWGARPDYGRPEVQHYILDNVKMWISDCRVDGLRVDSTIYIRNVKGFNNDPGNDLPEGWLLLQNLTTIARKINPNALLIAEDVAGNEYITKPHPEGGAGFNAQWELQFPTVLREALSSSNPASINLTGICSELSKRSNDDPFQRIIYSDSHDSAANGGARLNEAIAPGKSSEAFARKQSILAAAILLSTPGIPMLFQGQESMQAGSFNDWQMLDWEKTERFEGIVLAYKHLIALRKNTHGHTAGLNGHSVNIVHLDEVNKVLAYHRWDQGGPGDDTLIVINFGSQQFDQYMMFFPRLGNWKVRFNSSWKGYNPDAKEITIGDVECDSGEGSITLPGSCALILSQDK